MHWLPVGMILGSALYFALFDEPGVYEIGFALLLLVSALFARKYPEMHFTSYQIIGGCVCFLIMCCKTHFLSTPMLTENTKNVVMQGVVSAIANNQYKEDPTLKLTLDEVIVDGEKLGAKMRLNIPDEDAREIEINDLISVEADLYQIPMPCSLYGYFARRAAYLDGVAGSAKFLELLEHKITETGGLAKLRQKITDALLGNMDAPYGAISAALVTADQSYIPQELRQNFADAGLAHVLAISGLHLSIIAGLIFFIIRRILCLYPDFAIYQPTKKWAAVVAIAATAFYLAIANFGVPVQRSFVMISLAMFAICINRSAFSMRSLVIACIFVLLFSPERVLSASFQLSFSAVLGLLAFYEGFWPKIHSRLFDRQVSHLMVYKFFGGVMGIFATTLIASLATTPFAIAFFQRFSLVAILGNLLAIPFVSMFVMPLGLLSVITLFLFNGWDFAFYLWQISLKILCEIANWVASFPGAAILVKAVPNTAVVIFFYGMIWFGLWKKTWRWFGVIPMMLGVVIWRYSSVPFIYVNADANVMAVNDGGFAHILGNENNTFTTKIWLQEWGQSDYQYIDDGYLFFPDYNLLLINSPKEGIKYLINNENDFENIITSGYASTIKKYADPLNVIDRDDIRLGNGLAIFINPMNIVLINEWCGKRPWCA